MSGHGSWHSDRRQGQKESGTGDEDPELESVVAPWALGTPSGEGSGDSGRDWPPPVRSMRNGALPPARAHELHNVRLFTQLNGGVAPTQAVEEVGHGVEILLRVYGRCLKGQN